jgi:hypothetical protein
MNRRDFLKRAGVVAVGASAAASTLAETARATPNPTTAKDLRVTFNGPFCYWWQGDSVKVMAPPVGLDFKKAPHKSWLGTTTNETVIDVPSGTNLSLQIPGYTPWTSYKFGGTYYFECNQGTGTGTPPLFNLTVPAPYAVIGVHPTAARIICKPVPDPYCADDCNEWKIFASGLTFVYPIVDLTGVSVKNGSSTLFAPCFTNDDYLPDATLGVNLTPLQREDPNHDHAKLVWSQMVSMYPWMEAQITGIEFCANYKPASCDFDPKTCVVGPPATGAPQFGPGSDCQVPIMGLMPGGGTRKQRK